MAQITTGIKLEYSTTSSGSYTAVSGLYAVPELGKGTPATIEVTTLANTNRTYINGIRDPGSSGLAFSLRHDKTQFATIAGLEGQKLYWKVTYPDGSNGADGTVISFQGECVIQIDAATFNEAMNDTLTITPSTDITVA